MGSVRVARWLFRLVGAAAVAISIAAACRGLEPGGRVADPLFGDPSRRQVELLPGEPSIANSGYEAVIADCTARLEKNPKDAVALLRRGVTWQFKRNYIKALADLDLAVLLQPQQAQPLIQRGALGD